MVNGVHDMGGMHGFGPVAHEENEPVFHEPWEGRVYAMNAATYPPLFPNGDASRYALEVLPPSEYLNSSYYERWLRRAELRHLELGNITQEELDARIAYYREHPDAPTPQSSNPESMERARQRLARRPEPLHRPDGAPPRFSVGDPVVTRNTHPVGHTRLPRYARGKRGVITRVHGVHSFPDTNAHGLGPQPQGVYSVRFDAEELWGDSADGRGAVYLDLFDSYLEPAP